MLIDGAVTIVPGPPLLDDLGTVVGVVVEQVGDAPRGAEQRRRSAPRNVVGITAAEDMEHRPREALDLPRVFGGEWQTDGGSREPPREHHVDVRGNAVQAISCPESQRQLLPQPVANAGGRNGHDLRLEGVIERGRQNAREGLGEWQQMRTMVNVECQDGQFTTWVSRSSWTHAPESRSAPSQT